MTNLRSKNQRFFFSPIGSFSQNRLKAVLASHGREVYHTVYREVEILRFAAAKSCRFLQSEILDGTLWLDTWIAQSKKDITPPKINMEPGNDGFQ